MAGGIITALYQYPVKSMAGIPCERALALTTGFEWDRRWMLIDEENKMITQREMPVLCRFFPSIREASLQITYQEESYEIGLTETLGSHFMSHVFDDETTVVRTSSGMDAWLSERLSKKVRLVKIVERFHLAGPLNKTIEVSGADGYPYLVLGTASLEQLSLKSGETIDVRRFRPNIVVATQTPHEEDEWTTVTMGDFQLQKVKPCLRCQIIDIDQDLAERRGTVTKTLSTYRRMGNNIGFGASYVGLNSGELAVGNEFRGI